MVEILYQSANLIISIDFILDSKKNMTQYFAKLLKINALQNHHLSFIIHHFF